MTGRVRTGSSPTPDRTRSGCDPDRTGSQPDTGPGPGVAQPDRVRVPVSGCDRVSPTPDRTGSQADTGPDPVGV